MISNKMKSSKISLSILSYESSTLWLLLYALSAVYSNEINASNVSTQKNWPKAATSTTSASSRSFSLPFSLNSDGNVVIPGLYDSLNGIITPIQGQAQFRRLVLGLETADDVPVDVVGARNTTTTRALNDTRDIQQVANEIKQAAREQTISLVQFYMATCPDCQGFSPYFKRFAQSIEPHWSQLVKIYTVNCNDFLNINLCQEENPKLIVPMVRWYVMPIIQSDFQTHRYNFNYSKNLLNLAHRNFIEKQRRDMISLRRATLRFIDLMMDELLGDKKARKSDQSKVVGPTPAADELLLDSLPLRWRLLEPLGARAAHDEQAGLVVSSTPRNVRLFLDDLNGRARQCIREASAGPGNRRYVVRNFIVFEGRRSFVGRTLAADWSGLACSSERKLLATFHYTTDLLLLRLLNNKANRNSTLGGLNSTMPILMSFDYNYTTGTRPIEQLDELGSFKFLAANETSTKLSEVQRPKRHAHHRRPERLQQWTSLQKFYTKSQPPFRYANSMVSGAKRRQRRDSTAATRTETTTDSDQQAKWRAQAEAENINWAPEMLYPNEEGLRFEFNQRIWRELISSGANLSSWSPAGSAQGNPGEILAEKPKGSSIIKAKDDDLMLLLLTDYYRGLDEIVHVDLLSKGEVDYYQLLASSCFLRELIRYFPFQGNVLAADRHVLRYLKDEQTTTTVSSNTTVSGGPQKQVRQSSKSIARHYLQLIRMSYNEEVERQLGPGNILICSSLRSASIKDIDDNNNNNNNRTTFSRLDSNSNRLSEGTNRTGNAAERPPTLPLQPSTNSNRLVELFKIKTRLLERKLADIRRNYDVGLPKANNFGWKYCIGSNNYLRGHTCSLWILFHTLTVHEYLERLDELELVQNSSSLTPMSPRRSSASPGFEQKGAPEPQVRGGGGAKADRQYEFQIDYSRPPRRSCDPKNPDEALLASSSLELFVNQTQFVLANVINFVRFYLPCTNCAAHFSCMVEHSAGLSFGVGPANEPDSHLLWLWEGHNRVNERTRGSHSEDPTRPKHIFPVYEACPSCYLERPQNETSPFASMRFNRRELVKFLVARYQRSAILNNKINIEDLYKNEK